MNIKIAEPRHWESIIGIYNQAVARSFCTGDTDPATIESRHPWLEQHLDEAYPIFVAEDQENVLGWISLSPWRLGRKALRGTAEISYYLDDNYRGRGIASQLMEHAIGEAREREIQCLIAILMDVNQSSVRLLEKFDFCQWGHLPDVAKFEEGSCGQLIYGRKI